MCWQHDLKVVPSIIVRLEIAPEGLREHLKELPYETLPYDGGEKGWG